MECCSTAGLAHLLRFLRNPEVQMNGSLNELGERLRRSYVNLSRSSRYGRVCSSLHNIRLVQAVYSIGSFTSTGPHVWLVPNTTWDNFRYIQRAPLLPEP